jgi:hypothetical protein
MPRIQILELPEQDIADGISHTPFILILDEYGDRLPDEHERERLTRFREQCGAVAMFVSTDTIDIPANDLTGYAQQEAEQDTAAQKLWLNDGASGEHTDTVPASHRPDNTARPDSTDLCTCTHRRDTHALSVLRCRMIIGPYVQCKCDGFEYDNQTNTSVSPIPPSTPQ